MSTTDPTSGGEPPVPPLESPPAYPFAAPALIPPPADPAPLEAAEPLPAATLPPPIVAPVDSVPPVLAPAEAIAPAVAPAGAIPPVVPPLGGTPPVGPPAGVIPSDLPPPAPPKKRRRIGWIITVILLSLALIGTGAVLWLSLQRLEEAQQQIEEQEELIDEKEVFSSAMGELMVTVHKFDGLRYGELVPLERFTSLAGRGWDHRWNADALGRDTDEVLAATAELEAVLVAAQEQAASNASGTVYESVIDQLSGGFVISSMDDADALCESDVLGCVMWADPYTVHFDMADGYHESMTDWIRTGVAYHEFAHVLQMTNMDATDEAAKAFGGDIETMADCFALAYLPGWSLDHTVWVSDFMYYEVSVGYGYTCDEPQRQAVRDWYDALPMQAQPISQ